MEGAQEGLIERSAATDRWPEEEADRERHAIQLLLPLPLIVPLGAAGTGLARVPFERIDFTEVSRFSCCELQKTIWPIMQLETGG